MSLAWKLYADIIRYDVTGQVSSVRTVNGLHPVKHRPLIGKIYLFARKNVNLHISAAPGHSKSVLSGKLARPFNWNLIRKTIYKTFSNSVV